VGQANTFPGPVCLGPAQDESNVWFVYTLYPQLQLYKNWVFFLSLLPLSSLASSPLRCTLPLKTGAGRKEQWTPALPQDANDASCMVSWKLLAQKQCSSHCWAARRRGQCGCCPSLPRQEEEALSYHNQPQVLLFPREGQSGGENSFLLSPTSGSHRTPPSLGMWPLSPSPPWGADGCSQGAPVSLEYIGHALCQGADACVCEHADVHKPAGALWKRPACKESLRSLGENVLRVALARAHVASCSSLAQTQTATWQPQLVEKGAAGLLVGAGCPLAV
jgi:hypothetical protein